MATKKRTTRRPASTQDAGQPAAVQEPPAVETVEQEQTTDYTRCGGHILTEYGWVPERR
ncbi:MAG TPA: hypothetical protein VF202_01025 [Trueperaceae bacterium]